jgi:hypothetical protein
MPKEQVMAEFEALTWNLPERLGKTTEDLAGYVLTKIPTWNLRNIYKKRCCLGQIA